MLPYYPHDISIKLWQQNHHFKNKLMTNMRCSLDHCNWKCLEQPWEYPPPLIRLPYCAQAKPVRYFCRSLYIYIIIQMFLIYYIHFINICRPHMQIVVRGRRGPAPEQVTGQHNLAIWIIVLLQGPYLVYLIWSLTRNYFNAIRKFCWCNEECPSSDSQRLHSNTICMAVSLNYPHCLQMHLFSVIDYCLVNPAGWFWVIEGRQKPLSGKPICFLIAFYPSGVQWP